MRQDLQEICQQLEDPDRPGLYASMQAYQSWRKSASLALRLKRLELDAVNHWVRYFTQSEPEARYTRAAPARQPAGLTAQELLSSARRQSHRGGRR